MKGSYLKISSRPQDQAELNIFVDLVRYKANYTRPLLVS